MKHRSFWDLTALFSCVCIFCMVILPAPFIFGPAWFCGGESWIIVGIICAAELVCTFIAVSFLRRQYRRWMNQYMWRMKLGAEQPTVPTKVIHAEDRMEMRKGAYNLFICHVATMQGEGFMPSYRHKDTGGGYHDQIFYGTTRRIYRQAMRHGLAHLKAGMKRS